MEYVITTETLCTLTLTESETIWLKEILQNPGISEPKKSWERKLRTQIVKALAQTQAVENKVSKDFLGD